MKRIILPYIIGLLAIIVLLNSILSWHAKTTDSYIRNRVIQLTGNQMACTGIEIKAPSGRTYILSAAHCRVLATDDKMEAKTEQGKIVTVSIIEFDVEHDLLLLTPADGLSIEVAKKIYDHEKIHTITHGGHFPSYRTDGELLEERTVYVRGESIQNAEDMARCPSTDYSNPMFDEGGLFCSLRMTMHVSTALVIPGSSGGPALDSSGRLIGIVSCSAGQFSGLVPLHDIQEFLKGH